MAENKEGQRWPKQDIDPAVLGTFAHLYRAGVVARIGCQVLTQAFATTTDMLNAA